MRIPYSDDYLNVPLVDFIDCETLLQEYAKRCRSFPPIPLDKTNSPFSFKADSPLQTTSTTHSEIPQPSETLLKDLITPHNSVRKNLPKSKRIEHVKSFIKGSESVKKFCNRHNLVKRNFRSWLKKYKDN